MLLSLKSQFSPLREPSTTSILLTQPYISIITNPYITERAPIHCSQHFLSTYLLIQQSINLYISLSITFLKSFLFTSQRFRGASLQALPCKYPYLPLSVWCPSLVKSSYSFPHLHSLDWSLLQDSWLKFTWEINITLCCLDSLYTFRMEWVSWWDYNPGPLCYFH